MLPIIAVAFGSIFLLLSRLRPSLPSAADWGVAFISGALAFSSYLLPMPADWQTMLADGLFFVSFYFYGNGLLVRFGRPRLVWQRVGFIALCLAVDAYLIFVLRSLETEIVFVDCALSLLLAIPVAMVLPVARGLVDRALVVVAGLLVADNLVRTLVFCIFLGMSDTLGDFAASPYASYMQVSAGLLGIAFALAAMGSILADLFRRYREAADCDPLTGLYNRRGFEDALRQTEVVGLDGALLVVDIDHFKQVNDLYGHAIGDDVLVELSRLVKGTLPDTAMVARFGGEEFVAYLPHCSSEQAEMLAYAMCAQVAGFDWQRIGLSHGVTVSIGLASTQPADRSIHDALARADRLLYVAKARGRNQVISEHMADPPAVGELRQAS